MCERVLVVDATGWLRRLGSLAQPHCTITKEGHCDHNVAVVSMRPRARISLQMSKSLRSQHEDQCSRSEESRQCIDIVQEFATRVFLRREHYGNITTHCVLLSRHVVSVGSMKFSPGSSCI